MNEIVDMLDNIPEHKLFSFGKECSAASREYLPHCVEIFNSFVWWGQLLLRLIQSCCQICPLCAKHFPFAKILCSKSKYLILCVQISNTSLAHIVFLSDMSSVCEINVDTNDDDSSNVLTVYKVDLTCDLTSDFLCICHIHSIQHIAPKSEHIV